MPFWTRPDGLRTFIWWRRMFWYTLTSLSGTRAKWRPPHVVVGCSDTPISTFTPTLGPACDALYLISLFLTLRTITSRIRPHTVPRTSHQTISLRLTMV